MARQPRFVRIQPERHEPDLAGQQAVLRRPGHPHRDVGVVAQHILDAVAGRKLERQPGVSFLQGGQDGRQDFHADDFACGDADGAGDGACVGRGGAHEQCRCGFHGLRRVQQAQRQVGGDQAGGRAHEQRRAEPCLKLVEMAADGRLRHVQRAGRARQAALAQDGKERSPQRPVEVLGDHTFPYSRSTVLDNFLYAAWSGS